jgi:hypothetical protein
LLPRPARGQCSTSPGSGTQSSALRMHAGGHRAGSYAMAAAAVGDYEEMLR